MKPLFLITGLALLASHANAQLYIRDSPIYTGTSNGVVLRISQWDQYNVTLTQNTPIKFDVPVITGVMAFRVNICENGVGGYTPSFSVAPPSTAAIIQLQGITQSGTAASTCTVEHWIYRQSTNQVILESVDPPSIYATAIVGNLNGIINVVGPPYNASGSDNSYTCSITAGQVTLTCTTSTDFKVGQQVMILGAGAATPLTAPTISSIGGLGTGGATNDCYAAITGDPYEGTTAASSCVCKGTGPAEGAFSPTSGLNINFTAMSGSNGARGIYRTIGTGVCTGGKFINVLSGTQYHDQGNDMPSGGDWPATLPTGARKQALFATIVNGGGTTWTISTPAITTVASVTTRHDDTVAINAAILANPGAQIHFPAGTYHVNQVPNFSAANTYAYSFTSANQNGTLYGHIISTQSNQEFYGDGEDVTNLVDDWTSSFAGRSVFWGFAAPGKVPAAPLQTGVGTYAFPVCTLNNATDGAHSVVLITPGCAATDHLAAGDLVWLTGGIGVDASYTASFSTLIKSINTTSGEIILADPLPWPMPYGGTGATPVIMDLTYNQAGLANLRWHDINFNVYADLIGLDASYRVQMDHIRSKQYPRQDADFIYGQFAGHLTFNHDDFIASQQATIQFTINDNLDIENTNWYFPYPGQSSIGIKGGTSPVTFINNEIHATCGSGYGLLTLQNSINRLIVTNNRIVDPCTVLAPGIGAGAAIMLNNNSGSTTVTAADWLVSNNIVDTGQLGSLAVGTNATSSALNCLISDNEFTQNARSTDTPDVVLLGSPCKFSGNRLVTNATGTTTGVGIDLFEQATGTNYDIDNNTVIQGGTDNLICIQVGDPGAPATTSVHIKDNHCVGSGSAMATGIKVASVGNLPKIFLENNILSNVTAPYAPTYLIFDGPHGLAGGTFATPASDCGTAPGLIKGTDSDGFVTTGTTWSSCKVTFSSPWSENPQCQVTDSTAAIAIQSATTVNDITMTPAGAPVAAAHTLMWHCPQLQ